MPDRYLRIVLTVIALELFWIGVKDFATPVGAQQARAQAPNAQGAPQAPATAPVPTPQPLPVVVTGIDIDPARITTRSLLPVYSARTLKIEADRPIKIDADRPIPVVGAGPFTVQTDKPLPIRTDKPLQIESVPYKPGLTPGTPGE